MPLSEICNALVVTYVATEYHVAFEKSSSSSSLSIARFFQKTFIARRHNQLLLVALLVVNVLERVTGAASILKEFFEQLLHAPKIVLAALLYVASLYYDCLNYVPDLPLSTFLSRVGICFLKLLPIYPFLAVLMAFVFGGLIEVFEQLHIPLRYLNAPIYYGVLYGPFSTIYFQVKRGILEEQLFSIPMTTMPTKTAATTLTATEKPGRNGIRDAPIQYSQADYFQPKVKPLPPDFFTNKNHRW